MQELKKKFIAVITGIVLCGCDTANFHADKRELASNSKNEVAKRDVNSAALEILTAILNRNQEKLAGFTEEPELFFENQKLSSEVFNFLYQNDNLTGIHLSIDDFTIKTLPQGNNIYIVLYAQKNESRNFDDMQFLKQEWMKRYFACGIHLAADGRVFLHENFCFAETDGPFPPDVADFRNGIAAERITVQI